MKTVRGELSPASQQCHTFSSSANQVTAHWQAELKYKLTKLANAPNQALSPTWKARC